ncbi:hypothetical protein CERZMDRAFT_46200 [Cercospora zeae-maydis SCOH1-5]|uniref:Uncharacterized protein n=1 Tax=Cercospora zeae-maydis SCOH1-5 TaxID=717836 RepID=A0A6A6F938_9PEZI|nr:hypothetical protein CERZMDRAFT_46200 [Cercospora zeae-maydis SCOH1-5]
MGSLPSERRFKASSVCIIGAGPSGLAAAKYLLAEKKAFSRIVVYEQRARMGGLWNYSSDDGMGSRMPVPQTSPNGGGFAEAGRKRGSGNGNGEEKQPEFVSPVYERLETNIPRGLMGFSDLDWEEHRQLFPKHEDVLEYIQRYGEEVADLVKFGTQVLDVRLRGEDEDDGEKWIVTTRPVQRTRNLQSIEKEEEEEEQEEEVFDAVICANGHYEVPYIPDVPGISAWNEAHPDVISHSKFYRKPESFAGKKVLVIGNSASGLDISAQIEPYCAAPLIISQKSESYLNVGGNTSPSSSSSSSSLTATRITKPEIIEYIPSNRTVKFSDNTTTSHLDAILYCTGYFYSYPFLSTLTPPVITSGERVEHTFNHIFYAPHPTLSFMVLNQKVIPFPMAEAQAAVIARVLSGRLALPREEEMKRWEEGVEKEMGTGRNFHVLKFPKDAEQINFLGEWARSADQESPSSSPFTSSSEDSEGVGKTPPHWGEKEFFTRERFPHIKSAFNALGEKRHEVRSLEEVGFDFEKWKAEQK